MVAEKPHPWFKREVADLVYEATVSLKAALTGCKVTLKDLQGEEVSLTTNTPVQTGSERRIKYVCYCCFVFGVVLKAFVMRALRIFQNLIFFRVSHSPSHRGHGMPDRKRGGQRGDIIVRFKVRMPTSIPADRLSALKEALAGL